MVGVGAGAGAGAGAVFAASTGENWGGPVFFDGFVFCLAFLPVAWSFRRRSWRAGEPLLIPVDGDAAFLPPDVGRGIWRVSCDCCGCPRLATPSFGTIPRGEPETLVCL